MIAYAIDLVRRCQLMCTNGNKNRINNNKSNNTANDDICYSNVNTVKRVILMSLCECYRLAKGNSNNGGSIAPWKVWNHINNKTEHFVQQCFDSPWTFWIKNSRIHICMSKCNDSNGAYRASHDRYFDNLNFAFSYRFIVLLSRSHSGRKKRVEKQDATVRSYVDGIFLF